MTEFSLFIGGFGLGLLAGVVMYFRDIKRLRDPQESTLVKIVDAFKVGLAVKLDEDTAASARQLWAQTRRPLGGFVPPENMAVPRVEAALPKAEPMEYHGRMDGFMDMDVRTTPFPPPENRP